MTIFNLTPIAKPRMTRSDKWNPRKIVMDYWAYCDQLNYTANLKRFILGRRIDVMFLLPMPKTWSKTKKSAMRGVSHTQDPDTDNLLKGFTDAFKVEDNAIWDMRGRKYWWDFGAVIVLGNNGEIDNLVENTKLYAMLTKNGV